MEDIQIVIQTKEQYIKMLNDITESIENLIRVRNEIELKLLLCDEDSIHPEDRNPFKYRLD